MNLKMLFNIKNIYIKILTYINDDDIDDNMNIIKLIII